MTRSSKSTYGALFLMVSLVLVPMTALATHNSLGGSVHIVQADEFDPSTNELVPNIPHDTSPYVQVFHDNLDTPRLAPEDQTGTRYTDCATWASFDGDQKAYQDALSGGTACYIGFMDAQFEYLLPGSLLLPKRSDSLYPVNPTPDDTYCLGQEDPEQPTGVGAADEAFTRVNRSINDPACEGDNHDWLVPASPAMDVNLLDAPFQGGQGAPSVVDVTGTDPGSGTLFWPFMTTPYLFLFGQPHPDNENPSSFEAGQGVFGPNPAAGGTPLTDLGGACGDRTQECRLLTPDDILAYDDNTEGLGDVAGFGSQARVCDFRPQFVTVNPDGRDAGLCGVFGDVFNQFFSTDAAGGLGIPGAPATWMNTLPGWYEGVLMITGGEGLALLDAADEPTGDGEFDDGIMQYVAVNPKVPTDTDALWCVRPNFLAEGDSTKAGGLTDPGLYGAYQAHGIDSDVYVSPFLDQYRTFVSVARPPVQEALDTVDDATEDAGGVLEDVLDEVPGLPSEVEELLAQVTEAQDRADYQESEDPANIAATFSKTFEAGLGCNGQGVVEVRPDPLTLAGGLRFNLDVDQETVALKDPTLLDEEGLPARESETSEGGWMADVYNFAGVIHGVVDTNNNTEFDACATANGQPQPDNDLCAWQAFWDAYNPACTNIANTECAEILDGMGYDLDTGVGLYAVARISGPVVVSDGNAPLTQPGSSFRVLGAGNAAAQHCIVATSTGFAEKLQASLGETTLAALRDTLCTGTDGERVFVQDGFDDQSGVNPGSFSGAVEFAKLVPTPNAAQTATGLGAGDGICVTGVWNVKPDTVAADTKGNVELTGHNAFTDCFSFEHSV